MSAVACNVRRQVGADRKDTLGLGRCRWMPSRRGWARSGRPFAESGVDRTCLVRTATGADRVARCHHCVGYASTCDLVHLSPRLSSATASGWLYLPLWVTGDDTAETS